MNKRRILIYGMQSSGASTFAMSLAQDKNFIAFPDVWCRQLPNMSQVPSPMLAKFVCTTNYTYEQVVEMVQPDIKVLFLRDPVATIASLRGKGWRDAAGFMWDKIKYMDRVYSGKNYDLCVCYEDMMLQPHNVEVMLEAHGLKMYRQIDRGLEQIQRDNGKWSKLTQWGSGAWRGQITWGKIERGDIPYFMKETLRERAPEMMKLYYGEAS